MRTTNREYCAGVRATVFRVQILDHNPSVFEIRDRIPDRKNIDLRLVVRDHRDLIGAVSRCVRQPRRPSKLPQIRFQRCLTG